MGLLGKTLEGAYKGVRCEVATLGTSAVCLGGSAVPQEAWRALCLAEHLGCCLPDLVPWLPDWPAWEEISPAGGRWAPGWEAGEAAWLPPSLEEGGVTGLPATWEAWDAWLPAWDATKLLPSLGGRWVPVWLPAWDKLLASPEWRWAPAWEVIAWLPAWDTLLPSPRGRRVPAWDKLLASPEWRWAPAWEVIAWLPASDTLLPSPRGRRVPAWLPAWDKLLPSQWGRWAPACLPDWVACAAKLLPSLGRRRACLPALEAKLGGFRELALVIFPSFLFSKLLNLFNCLCLTLINLISSTLSMKPWHSLSLFAEIIDADCDWHNSVCLAMLSRILFIAYSCLK